MKRVVFSGYYGMRNYGDDLFGVVNVYGARRWWPQLAPAILAPRIAGQDECFTVPAFIPSDRYASDYASGKLIRALFMGKELLNDNLLVFGGGSLFSSNRSKIMNVAGRISGVRGKKLAAIGVSIGPFDTRASEKSTLGLLRRFEYISVRDHASYEFLKGHDLEARVAYGRDLAGLAVSLAGPANHHSGDLPLLGYAPCAVHGQPEIARRIDDIFVETVRRRRELSVRVFNLNDHPIYGDSQRSHYVHRRLADLGISTEVFNYAHAGVLGTWHAIAECSAMISVRMHGAITAYLTGVPFILFEYHKKCSDFLDDIGQSSDIRVGTSDAELATLESDGFDTQLGRLISSPRAPVLDPVRYADESALHFTQAPWALSGEDS
ncbi:polysaccharide pyruvyl transferase family protein [[Pseudomonas] boreopolis]|uniref:polysaccharide pyruvyl transferase family protein n=1 Tax=Xanthomonas boreopolis TaxID=86183 RepID=UPI003DA1C54F